MLDEAEETLLVLADPLPWQWQELMRIGYWVTNYDGIRYIIRPTLLARLMWILPPSMPCTAW